MKYLQSKLEQAIVCIADDILCVTHRILGLNMLKQKAMQAD